MATSIGNVYNIIDYGAIPDGATPATPAFAAAIAAAAAAGGGTIHVPAGVFLSGPIHLQSHLTLHLDAGARIAFSQKTSDYPLVHMRWEGSACDCYSPQIFGQGLESVAIVGRGDWTGRAGPGGDPAGKPARFLPDRA